MLIFIIFLGFILALLFATYTISRAQHNTYFTLEPSALPSEHLTPRNLEHIHALESAFLQEDFTFIGDYHFIPSPKPSPHPIYNKYYIHQPTQSLATISLSFIYNQSTKRTTASIASDIICLFEDNYQVIASTSPPPHFTPRKGPFLYWLETMTFHQWVKNFKTEVARTAATLPFVSYTATQDVKEYLRSNYTHVYDLWVHQKEMTYNPSTQSYSFTFAMSFHILLLSVYYHFYKIPKLRKKGYPLSTPIVPEAPPMSRKKSIILYIIIYLVLFAIIFFISSR